MRLVFSPNPLNPPNGELGNFQFKRKKVNYPTHAGLSRIGKYLNLFIQNINPSFSNLSISSTTFAKSFKKEKLDISSGKATVEDFSLF